MLEFSAPFAERKKLYHSTGIFHVDEVIFRSIFRKWKKNPTFLLIKPRDTAYDGRSVLITWRLSHNSGVRYLTCIFAYTNFVLGCGTCTHNAVCK